MRKEASLPSPTYFYAVLDLIFVLGNALLINSIVVQKWNESLCLSLVKETCSDRGAIFIETQKSRTLRITEFSQVQQYNIQKRFWYFMLYTSICNWTFFPKITHTELLVSSESHLQMETGKISISICKQGTENHFNQSDQIVEEDFFFWGNKVECPLMCTSGQSPRQRRNSSVFSLLLSIEKFWIEGT